LHYAYSGGEPVLPDHIRLKNINHTTYNVKNKDAALQWYQDILGLRQIPKMVDSDHLYWLQLPSGAMVHIIENPDAPSAPSHHTAFEVDDIVAAHTYIRSKGVTPTDIQTRHDGQQAFYINDPDGNRIEICTKSGFGVLV
jgi:catechol 2,3-dioxygenase-like lactoylglutathione lyase family enzyme